MLSSEVLLRRPRRGATGRLTLMTLGFLALAIPSWGAYSWWAFRHELRTDCNITGPPCPPARDSWRSVVASRKPREFNYGGMHIAHPFGGADCSPVPEDYFSARAYSVCQFTAPVMIAVTVGARTQLFEPGYGRRATVKLRNGQLTCVQGGWLTL
jgi:hypothetical protein